VQCLPTNDAVHNLEDAETTKDPVADKHPAVDVSLDPKDKRNAIFSTLFEIAEHMNKGDLKPGVAGDDDLGESGSPVINQPQLQMPMQPQGYGQMVGGQGGLAPQYQGSYSEPPYKAKQRADPYWAPPETYMIGPDSAKWSCDFCRSTCAKYSGGKPDCVPYCFQLSCNLLKRCQCQAQGMWNGNTIRL